jgi:hypothetical protein
MSDLTELAREVLGTRARHPRNADPIFNAHRQMIAKLWNVRPPRMYVEPDPSDFENVRDYLADCREIVNAWLKEVGAEVQSNAIVKLDLTQFSIEGLSDCEGECNRAAAALIEDREYSR